MKALSLTQPWASLVAFGEKRIETRSWATRYRGPIAIHASSNYPRIFQRMAQREPFFTALRHANGGPLPRGAIIAVTTIEDCLPTEYVVKGKLLLVGYEAHPDSNEYRFGDYGPRRWAWMLGKVERVQIPVVCAGALGLWSVPDKALETLCAQTRLTMDS